MKKILLIAMLAFTSTTYADDTRFSMAVESGEWGGVWIIDNESNKLIFCSKTLLSNEFSCSEKPVDLEKEFKD
jgi:hypothetical protein